MLERLGQHTNLNKRERTLASFNVESFIRGIEHNLSEIGITDITGNLQISNKSIVISAFSKQSNGLDLSTLRTYDKELGVFSHNKDLFRKENGTYEYPIFYLELEMPSDDIFRIKFFAVNSELESNGIGSELYNNLLTLAKKSHVDFICGTQSSQKGIDFFLNRGRFLIHEIPQKQRNKISQLIGEEALELTTVEVLDESLRQILVDKLQSYSNQERIDLADLQEVVWDILVVLYRLKHNPNLSKLSTQLNFINEISHIFTVSKEQSIVQYLESFDPYRYEGSVSKSLKDLQSVLRRFRRKIQKNF